MLPSLTSTIAAYGLSAKKSFGQHFLLDEHVTDKVARAAGDMSACNVIEIGPGPGGLTRSLLKANAKSVTAIEMDARCVEALQELVAAYPERLRVLKEDGLKAGLLSLVPAPRKIVANLPYNVGTLMLVKWLQEVAANASAYASMTLMFQREVAQRIVAQPGGKDYGRISVLAQWLCEAKWHFDLPPGAFSPPPKVDSSVISLIPRGKPLHDVRLKSLERVLAAAFGQRRKMLRQALKTSGVNAEMLLERADLDGTRRAETLSVSEFCALAQAYSELTNSPSQR